MDVPANLCLVHLSDLSFPESFNNGDGYDFMFKLNNSEVLGNDSEIELTCKLLFENGGEVVLQGNVPPMTLPQQIFLTHTGVFFEIKFETLSVDHGNQLFCLQLEANGIETYRSPPFSVIVKPDQRFIPRQILHNLSNNRPRRTSEARDQPRSPQDVLNDLTSSTTAIQAHVTELSTYFSLTSQQA
jgi:hypothetical protein